MLAFFRLFPLYTQLVSDFVRTAKNLQVNTSDVQQTD